MDKFWELIDEEKLIWVQKSIDKLFEEDLITKDIFIEKACKKLRKFYIPKFKITDDEIIMKQKRQLLDVWTQEDEDEFTQNLQTYKSLVTEYKQIKETLITLTDKQELLDYYRNIILPKLYGT